MPFVVAINCFDGAPRYDPQDVRIALDLDPERAGVLCDARQPALGQTGADRPGRAHSRQRAWPAGPPAPRRPPGPVSWRAAALIPAGAWPGQGQHGSEGRVVSPMTVDGRAGRGAGGTAGKAEWCGQSGRARCLRSPTASWPGRRRRPASAAALVPGPPSCWRRAGWPPGDPGLAGVLRQDPGRGWLRGVAVAVPQGGVAGLGDGHEPGVGAVRLRGGGSRGEGRRSGRGRRDRRGPASLTGSARPAGRGWWCSTI